MKEYDSSKTKFLETSFKTFLLECFSAATEGNALKFAAMVEFYRHLVLLVALFKLGQNLPLAYTHEVKHPPLSKKGCDYNFFFGKGASILCLKTFSVILRTVFKLLTPFRGVARFRPSCFTLWNIRRRKNGNGLFIAQFSLNTLNKSASSTRPWKATLSFNNPYHQSLRKQSGWWFWGWSALMMTSCGFVRQAPLIFFNCRDRTPIKTTKQ